MPVFPDVHIMNGKNIVWLGVYIWKVVMNLLNISFTEGVTDSHPNEVYSFQQVNALAHHAHQIVELLCCEKPNCSRHVAARQPGQ